MLDSDWLKSDIQLIMCKIDDEFCILIGWLSLTGKITEKENLIDNSFLKFVPSSFTHSDIRAKKLVKNCDCLII